MSNDDDNHGYTQKEFSRLKYKFRGAKAIQRNFSQAFQDMFVLTMLNGKSGGSFVEIGAFDPIKNSNTYLLETQYDWRGISIDIADIPHFHEARKSELIVQNALTIDFQSLFSKKGLSSDIDYLQLDIDPPANTLECLKRIPFDLHRFAVITYETDHYCGSDRITNESREIILSHGYKLLGGHICVDTKDYPFEDWYVHPKLVSAAIIDVFAGLKYYNDTAETFLLT